MSKQTLFKALPVIILSSLLAIAIIYAWTEPTQAPPQGNIASPINVSTTTQYKSGALGIGGVFQTDIDTHLAIVSGNVGIGTTAPTQKLDVAGDVRWTGVLQGGFVPWTRLTSFPSACPSGQYVTAIGSSLTCSTPAAGGSGDITGVYAGTGLSGGGSAGEVTLFANTTYLQRRVTGSCASNQAIRVINADGTVTCVNLPSSAICTWGSKTYSTGATCLAPCGGDDCLTFGGNWKQYTCNCTCGVDGSWTCTKVYCPPVITTCGT